MLDYQIVVMLIWVIQNVYVETKLEKNTLVEHPHPQKWTCVQQFQYLKDLTKVSMLSDSTENFIDGKDLDLAFACRNTRVAIGKVISNLLSK